MYVRRLCLTNFRCYRQLDLELPAGTVVLCGGNAAGKSTLLESLFVLATTRSPHAGSDRQLIHWDAATDDLPFSRIVGEVVRADGLQVIDVTYAREGAPGSDERFAKRVRMNGVVRRALDVIGQLRVVLFTPRDLQIVDGSPADRRRYLDVLLCQIDPRYCRALGQYNRVMRQRNHLLRQLRERGGDRAQLSFWDGRLAEAGAVVMGGRWDAIAALRRHAAVLHADLAGDGPPLTLVYRGPLERPTGSQVSPAAGAAEPAEHAGIPLGGEAGLSASLLALLAERRSEEIARGATVVGPHRDDIALEIGGVDMRTYGSRGQQRTIALALKLAEARMMADRSGEPPLLMLDDVLSELDADRREHLLAHIDRHQQTLVTATDVAAVPAAFLAHSLLLEVDAARVSKATSAALP